MFSVGQRVRRKKEWLSHEFWRNHCPTGNLNGVFVVRDFTHDNLFLHGSDIGFSLKCFEPAISNVDLSSYM